MLVEVTELIFAAGTFPNRTLAPFWKSVPVMATVVPPVVGPVAGEMPVSFGGVMAFSQLLLLAEPAPPPQATRKLIKVRHAAATAEVLSIPSLLSTGMFIDTLLACPDPIVPILEQHARHLQWAWATSLRRGTHVGSHLPKPFLHQSDR
jgi:hypothetical protein